MALAPLPLQTAQSPKIRKQGTAYQDEGGHAQGNVPPSESIFGGRRVITSLSNDVALVLNREDGDQGYRYEPPGAEFLACGRLSSLTAPRINFALQTKKLSRPNVLQ